MLADPSVTVHDASGSIVVANDNWKEGRPSELEALGMGSPYAVDAALIADLPPASYTAVVRRVDGTSGVALAEVYLLD